MEKNPTTLFVVAAALTNESGAILLQKRPDHASMGGLWEFPGGKVETGESPEAALTRELFEELGISVNPQDLIAETFASEPLGDRHLLLLLYRCVRWKGTPTAHFASEIAWVHPNDMAALPMPPADYPLVERLNRI
jgi:8-oxo-dGTP diphosphatase